MMKIAVVCVVMLAMMAISASAEDASEWEVIGTADPSAELRLILAIKQQNIDQLNTIFWAVSTPGSPQYGKFLTSDEVSELVMPTEQSIDAVIAWVSKHGVEDEIDFTKSRDMAVISTSVEIASRMLNAKYLVHQSRSTGNKIIKATEAYTIPAEMKQHLDFVVGHTSYPLSRPVLYTVDADAAITPVTLRQRYNVSSNLIGTAKNNSLAVAEFQAQYYSDTDLKQFFQAEVPYAKNAYTVDHVIGNNDASNPGVEANLDIQFIMGVAPNISAWFWSNPAYDFFTDIVTWLGQIDNTTEAPFVHSISYGSQTQWPTSDIHSRVDIEFQKIGARGISIIFASGDSGTGCILCYSFKPSWPASSIYVTSVGATRFIDGVSGDEMAVDEFGSGGGFSSADNQPSYQSAAVANYFKTVKELPDSHYYNKTGRGTPDVAALGIGFQVVVRGAVESVGGTSASAPTFSAIISLLNDQRFNANKPSLGFLNPWLYQTQAANPNAFFDVTEGDNQHGCCGLTGFRAAKGWDPVTGLGTPNFAVLSQLV